MPRRKLKPPEIGEPTTIQTAFHLVFINACQHCKVESKVVGLYRTRQEADEAMKLVPVISGGGEHPMFQTQIHSIEVTS